MEVECAHCGNKQLMQIPGTWTPMAMGENGIMSGPAIPLVILGCPSCGFISLFSPQAIAAQPWPENEQAENQ